MKQLKFKFSSAVEVEVLLHLYYLAPPVLIRNDAERAACKRFIDAGLACRKVVSMPGPDDVDAGASSGEPQIECTVLTDEGVTLAAAVCASSWQIETKARPIDG